MAWREHLLWHLPNQCVSLLKHSLLKQVLFSWLKRFFQVQVRPNSLPGAPRGARHVHAGSGDPRLPPPDRSKVVWHDVCVCVFVLPKVATARAPVPRSFRGGPWWQKSSPRPRWWASACSPSSWWSCSSPPPSPSRAASTRPRRLACRVGSFTSCLDSTAQTRDQMLPRRRDAKSSILSRGLQLGNFTSQEFDVFLHIFRVDSSSPQISANTCWPCCKGNV